jgi:hypothetical protein
MRHCFVAGDGEDLSNDVDEDFICGMGLEPQDVALYGKACAKYKGCVKLELFDMEENEDVGVNDQERSSDEVTARRFI